MADVHDKKTWSYNLSCYRDKNTKPEMLVRKFIFTRYLYLNETKFLCLTNF